METRAVAQPESFVPREAWSANRPQSEPLARTQMEWAGVCSLWRAELSPN